MMIKNNYDLYWETKDGKMTGTGIFNGDMGVINIISDNGIEVIFDDEKYVLYRIRPEKIIEVRVPMEYLDADA